MGTLRRLRARHDWLCALCTFAHWPRRWLPMRPARDSVGQPTSVRPCTDVTDERAAAAHVCAGRSCSGTGRAWQHAKAPGARGCTPVRRSADEGVRARTRKHR